MKYKNLWIVAAVLTLCACNKNPQFKVCGIITDGADQTLYLEELTTDNGAQVLDSVTLDADGAFELSADAPSAPNFFLLRLVDQTIPFSVDSTETITIQAKAADMGENYSLEGSDNSLKIKEINSLMNQLSKEAEKIQKDPSLYPSEMTDSLLHLRDHYKILLRDKYIYPAPHTTYAYYAVSQAVFEPQTDRESAKCFAAVATAWDTRYPDSPRTKAIKNVAAKSMKLTSPQQSKELKFDDSKVKTTGILSFSLPDVNGRQHPITEMKGKVTLLDFSNYDSQESMQYVLFLRELYNKYHEQGFEIYQVSIDNNEHKWKQTVGNLPWICVRDANGSVAQLYAVQQLPTFFIIDRNNEIVKRSDDITDLEAEIERIL